MYYLSLTLSLRKSPSQESPSFERGQYQISKIDNKPTGTESGTYDIDTWRAKGPFNKYVMLKNAFLDPPHPMLRFVTVNQLPPTTSVT